MKYLYYLAFILILNSCSLNSVPNKSEINDLLNDYLSETNNQIPISKNVSIKMDNTWNTYKYLNTIDDQNITLINYYKRDSTTYLNFLKDYLIFEKLGFYSKKDTLITLYSERFKSKHYFKWLENQSAVVFKITSKGEIFLKKNKVTKGYGFKYCNVKVKKIIELENISILNKDTICVVSYTRKKTDIEPWAFAHFPKYLLESKHEFVYKDSLIMKSKKWRVLTRYKSIHEYF